MNHLILHEDGKHMVELGRGSVEDCKRLASEHAGKDLSWSKGLHQEIGFASSDPFPHYEINSRLFANFQPTQENTASPIADAVFELVNALKFAGVTNISIYLSLGDDGASDDESPA